MVVSGFYLRLDQTKDFKLIFIASPLKVLVNNK